MIIENQFLWIWLYYSLFDFPAKDDFSHFLTENNILIHYSAKIPESMN